MKLIASAGGVVMATLIASFILVVLVVTGAGGDGRLAAAACATDANLAPILATIRTIESGGDYTAEAAGSTASGAYQFIDGTWNNYGGYTRAAQAPPEQQDQKAAEMIRAVLAEHDNSVDAVPVVWYIGHLPDDGAAEWDTIPAPNAGNVLTPREYQTKWMQEYETQSAAADTTTCTSVVGTFGELPSSLDCSTIRWGGYPNGRIPTAAMRYRPHSGYLHPGSIRDVRRVVRRRPSSRPRPPRLRLPPRIRRRKHRRQVMPRPRPRHRHQRPRRRQPLPHRRRSVRQRRVHLAVQQRPSIRMDHTPLGHPRRHGVRQRRRHRNRRQRRRPLLLPRAVASRSGRHRGGAF